MASSPPCYLIRPFAENPDFFGRSEILATIKEVLKPPEEASYDNSTKGVRPVTLCGIGGIGKTQIALQYAFSCIRNNTYDAILWVHAENEEKLATSFTETAVQLELIERAHATNPVVVRVIVMEWLSKPVKSSEAGMNEGGTLLTL